ncbi:MAG: hypothetical protein AAGH99_05330 [Planctomycetota bacterium]
MRGAKSKIIVFGVSKREVGYANRFRVDHNMDRFFEGRPHINSIESF